MISDYKPAPLHFTFLPTKLSYLNFHSLGVVSRYRDHQLQVSENCSYYSAKTFANLDV